MTSPMIFFKKRRASRQSSSHLLWVQDGTGWQCVATAWPKGPGVAAMIEGVGYIWILPTDTNPNDWIEKTKT